MAVTSPIKNNRSTISSPLSVKISQTLSNRQHRKLEQGETTLCRRKSVFCRRSIMKMMILSCWLSIIIRIIIIMVIIIIMSVVQRGASARETKYSASARFISLGSCCCEAFFPFLLQLLTLIKIVMMMMIKIRIMVIIAKMVKATIVMMMMVVMVMIMMVMTMVMMVMMMVPKTGTDKRCVDRGRFEAQKVEDGSAQKVRRAPKKGGDDKRVRRIYAEEEDKAASASLSGRAPPS